MPGIKKKHSASFYSWLFAVVYFVSYITRINYGAIISQMAASEGMAKSSLSVALTGLFVTYGVGQLVSGVLGDKFQPKNVLFAGLVLSSAMNLVLPFCKTTFLMCAVWCVNGFAQALIWPPLVRMMTSIYDSDYYVKACTNVSNGGALGIMAVYMISPLIINISSWKWVFFISAILGFVMSALWMALAFKTENNGKNAKKTNDSETNLWKLMLTPAMIMIYISIILQGSLRDGVTTWTPSYLSENFGMTTSSAIFSGVVIPLVSIFVINFSSFVYRKLVRNPLTCACIFFCSALTGAVLLALVRGQNPFLSIAALALLCASAHGVNYILICMLPAYFNGTGKVSTISGIMNAFTYIGSAFSTYGFAKISEVFGWNATIAVWTVSAGIGAVLCALVIRYWKKKYMQN